MPALRILLSAACCMTLAACSSSKSTPDPDPFTLARPPAFEINRVKGSFRYVGDDIAMQAPVAGQKELIMPFPIRRVIVNEQNSGIRASSDYDVLKIQATNELGEEGSGLRVQLIDGRTVPFVITPLMSDVLARYRSDALGSEARASMRIAPVRKIPDFFAALSDGKGLPRDGMKNYAPSLLRFGRVVFDNGDLRAVIQQTYIGDAYTVYVLEVHNLSDREQEIKPSMLRFKSSLAVRFNKQTLEPYAMGVGYGKNVTKAYVLVSNKPIV